MLVVIMVALGIVSTIPRDSTRSGNGSIRRVPSSIWMGRIGLGLGNMRGNLLMRIMMTYTISTPIKSV